MVATKTPAKPIATQTAKRIARGCASFYAPAPFRIFRDGGYMCRGVEIFAAGTHRGLTYTTRDLDDMVDNFNQFSTGPDPRLRPTCVLGHEENQEFLDRSDLPAAAYPTRLYREGNTLKADVNDMAPSVAKLIQTRRYRKVSAEIYDEPPDGVPGHGKMLRRIAFLGGEIPQVKTLADIPTPEFSEFSGTGKFAFGRPAVARFCDVKRSAKTPGIFQAFSEITPMDRASMLDALKALGYDVSTVTDSMPDDALEGVLKSVQGLKAGATGDTGNGAAGDNGQPIAQNSDCPKMDDTPATDPNAPAVPMSSPPTPATPAVPGGPTHHPSKVTMQYSEEQMQAFADKAVSKALATVKVELASVTKHSSELATNTKRANLQAFVESQIKAGKILPSEMDATDGNPTILDRLMRANGSTVVRRFTDKAGKEQLQTDLDLQMLEIERRPKLVNFGDRMKQPVGAGGATQDDEHKTAAKAKFQQFSEKFQKQGVTEEQFVKTYEDARKMYGDDYTLQEHCSAV